jgi:predicted transposase YdaD
MKTMSQESHDHNFKNLFADFPKEALEWILPEATEKFGTVLKIEFVRQEPKKRKLSDSHLSLDMPILFSFEFGQILLWLTEFQEDKNRFSIYKLLRYVTDSAEAYPQALIIPTVLFTDRRKWRKDVIRQLESQFGARTFLHFEYVLIKLFDLNARDYYHSSNPLIKILLPKMNYEPEERAEVIRQALLGLYRLAAPMLFDKYSDFIDVYAEIREDERESIRQEISEYKEETAMLMQYLKEEGFKEGKQEGKQEGIFQGMNQGLSESLMLFLKARFGVKGSELFERNISKIADIGKLKALIEAVAQANSVQDVAKLV